MNELSVGAGGFINGPGPKIPGQPPPIHGYATGGAQRTIFGAPPPRQPYAAGPPYMVRAGDPVPPLPRHGPRSPLPPPARSPSPSPPPTPRRPVRPPPSRPAAQKLSKIRNFSPSRANDFFFFFSFAFTVVYFYARPAARRLSLTSLNGDTRHGGAIVAHLHGIAIFRVYLRLYILSSRNRTVTGDGPVTRDTIIIILPLDTIIALILGNRLRVTGRGVFRL